MKTYILKEPQQVKDSKPENRPTAARCARRPEAGPGAPERRRAGRAVAEVIKIGVDVGLNKYAYCRQVDGCLQEPPRMSDPEKFREFALAQKGLARRVVICYEAGAFGFELARWSAEQGLECLVMAPVQLDEGHRRVENDQLNAREIGSRLDRYLAGNHRALTVCRVPTRAEELARSQTRLRQQLLEERKALQARGRSLLWEFGYLKEGRSPWWEEAIWPGLAERLEATVASNLARLRAVLREVDQQLSQLVEQLREQANQDLPQSTASLPVGVGWLSMLILTRELMDWHRFGNRRQVGCLTGLVPSEASTGESRRQGSVTKVGNPRVRAILVEMAWRMVRYQPGCHAVKRWLPVLSDRKQGAATRKRAIVAVARVLAIDLWRMATGQTTAAQLGFRV